MLPDIDLVLERCHPVACVGGTQKIYRFKSGWGVSLINGKGAHAYPFAWEAAVLKNVSADGTKFEISYETELTDDVEIFQTDDQAKEFLMEAKTILEKR